MRSKLGAAAYILPHTRLEYRWFLLLSLTAGLYEELLYPGYLNWYLSPWLGVPGAFAAVIVLFGLAHVYQGGKGALGATIAGAAMGTIVPMTGRPVPAMVVHALVDASSGTAGCWLL